MNNPSISYFERFKPARIQSRVDLLPLLREIDLELGRIEAHLDEAFGKAGEATTLATFAVTG